VLLHVLDEVQEPIDTLMASLVLALCGEVPAQRGSRNRPRGTLETKPISVTKEVYKKFIMEKVLPADEEKWPQCHRNMLAIKLHQDNAKLHRIHNDLEVLEKLINMTVRVNLFDQPPNSPDQNAIDLGYFAGIQALQQKQWQRTVYKYYRNMRES
jgi:hypothetical protein